MISYWWFCSESPKSNNSRDEACRWSSFNVLALGTNKNFWTSSGVIILQAGMSMVYEIGSTLISFAKSIFWIYLLLHVIFVYQIRIAEKRKILLYMQVLVTMILIWCIYNLIVAFIYSYFQPNNFQFNLTNDSY